MDIMTSKFVQSFVLNFCESGTHCTAYAVDYSSEVEVAIRKLDLDMSLVKIAMA